MLRRHVLAAAVSGDIKSTLTNTVTDLPASEVGLRTTKIGTSNTGYQTSDRYAPAPCFQAI